MNILHLTLQKNSVSSLIITGGLPMSLPNKEEVKNHLSKIEPDIHQIVLGAWKDWQDSTESKRARFPRTRANIVWDRMIDRALDLFARFKEIKVVTYQNQTYSFIINDSVLFRFKKGNPKGLSQNYPTQLALAFHDHAQKLLFKGIEYSRVEIVYILNELETQIKNIQVIARNKNQILWGYNIQKPQNNIDELPIKTQLQPTSSQIRAKKQIKETLTKNE